MKEYILLTDAACDLSSEMFDKLAVPVIPILATVEGSAELPATFSDFYHVMNEGKKVTTAAPNAQQVIDFMEPYLKEGKDILYLAFSSALSYTCQAGKIAAEELLSRYPEAKIEVIDTLCASAGMGLLLLLTAQKKAAGASFEEAAAFAKETAPHICHYFTVDDLFFLKRGGRVSATSAIVGTMLSIKPVLHVDDGGHLVPIAKVKGRKKSLEALLSHMEEDAIDLKEQTVLISYGDCLEEASAFADTIRERFGVKEVRLFQISPVVGAHSGPTTIALFFVGQKR